MLFSGTRDRLTAWSGDHQLIRAVLEQASDPRLRRFGAARVLIKTREGVMRAELGDWIIKGVTGEYSSCDPDIFAANYEAA